MRLVWYIKNDIMKYQKTIIKILNHILSCSPKLNAVCMLTQIMKLKIVLGIR